MPVRTTHPFATQRKVAPMAPQITTHPPLPTPLAAAVDGAIAEAFSRSFFDDLRIPVQAGRVFRREAGRHSDLIPATIPE